MNIVRAGCLAALAALAAAPPSAAQEGQAPGRFEVVGRAPVGTRTTDLTVFRGVDGRTYALTGTFGGCSGCVGGRVYTWDVTDPAKPVLTDSVLVDARVVNDVRVNEAGTLAVATRIGSESKRDGLVVLDLADPAHPKVAADYFETVTGGVQNVDIEGDVVYAVNTGTADLHVIDVSDPRAPREVGRWGVPGHPGKFLQDVEVEDGLAYLAYWNDGLVILDVGAGVREGTPQEPAFVGQLRTRTRVHREEFGNTSTAVPYAGPAGRKYVFVGDKIFPDQVDLDREIETAGYVHVVDVSRPDNPREVAYYLVPRAGVSSLWVEGDTLYAAFHNGGLRAVDVSGDLRGELRGREIAALETADGQGFRPDLPFALGVQVHDGLVYASDLNSGLWVARLVPEAR